MINVCIHIIFSDRTLNLIPNYIKIKVSTHTVQKMKFSIKDFFIICDQIRRELRIWSHLLQKSFMESLSSSALTILLSYLNYVIVPLAFSIDLNSFFSQQKHITLLRTLFAWDISGNHLTLEKYHLIIES